MKHLTCTIAMIARPKVRAMRTLVGPLCGKATQLMQPK